MIQMGKYRHYKGMNYEVIGFAHDTETRSPLVLYKPLYRVPDLENNIIMMLFLLAHWICLTNHVTVNGNPFKRFELIIDPDLIPALIESIN